MLVVNYNENKPVNDYFKFSVQGNNKADIVRFVLLKKQGNIDLTSENYKAYVKAQTPEQDFVDKTMLTTKREFGNNLSVDWTLLAKHTQFKQLQVSISFEDETNEIVWQTQYFTMNIANGVNADQEIPNVYPTVIQEMQNEIDTKGSKLYKHTFAYFVASGTTLGLYLRLMNTSSEKINSYEKLYNAISNSPYLISCFAFDTSSNSYKIVSFRADFNEIYLYVENTLVATIGKSTTGTFNDNVFVF